MEAKGPASSSRRTSLAITWITWWAALAVIWLLLVDTIDTEELLVGTVAAAVAASVATAMHRRGYIRFWPRARWAREIPYVLWDVIVDCGLLAGALWRRLVLRQEVRGATIRVPFHYGGDNGRDGARRALVNFGVSLTPNSYVVDIDPEGDSVLVHRLVPVALDRLLLREQQRATGDHQTGEHQTGDHHTDR
jgi:multisubunit Na+/H+ antiporter MnhE subunit